MSELAYVNFPFKARFYSSGEINDDTKFICIAFHGYGQLAKYFIRDFEALGPKHVTIVPEGLHRFYREGMSGRVVASWMTKEDRLTDIENQSSYLNAIISLVKKRIENRDIKIWVLGFSQGVATVMRWMVSNTTNIEKAIFWAGSIPEDLPKEKVESSFDSVQCYSVIGDNDPYFQASTLSKQEELEKEYSISIEKIKFKGEHRINALVLKDIVKQKIES